MNIARRELLALGVGATVMGPVRALSRPASEAERESEAERALQDMEWTMLDAAEIGVSGRGWSDVEKPFHRLPARAKETVRDKVWRLSQETSGMFVTFRADSPQLRFEVELLSDRLAMSHMPATGVSGVDLYALSDDGSWRWVFCARPGKQSYAATIKGLAPGPRTYRLYFPLYNGVEALRIGVPKARKIEAVAPRAGKPIAYYGTSIAHGACATRPGMTFVNQLGRRLDVPMLNLGFSGNGRLEMEVADLLVELDARVYVLDCLPNLGAKQVAERAVPFVRRLRKDRPDTPIVMVEDRVNANATFLPGRAAHHERNHAAFRAAYDELVAEGVKGLTYVPDAPFLGTDGEATVDGSHPNDLGMVRYADALEPILRNLL